MENPLPLDVEDIESKKFFNFVGKSVDSVNHVGAAYNYILEHLKEINEKQKVDIYL